MNVWARRDQRCALLHRRRMEDYMDAELLLHIASRAVDLSQSGIPEAEAQRLARIEFGGRKLGQTSMPGRARNSPLGRTHRTDPMARMSLSNAPGRQIPLRGLRKNRTCRLQCRAES
jgi:hypothetical protein